MKTLFCSFLLCLSISPIAQAATPFRLVDPAGGMSVVFKSVMPGKRGYYQEGQPKRMNEPGKPYCFYELPVTPGAGTSISVRTISGRGNVSPRTFETTINFDVGYYISCYSTNDQEVTLEDFNQIFGGSVVFTNLKIQPEGPAPLGMQSAVQFNAPVTGIRQPPFSGYYVLFQNQKILDSWGTGPFCYINHINPFSLNSGAKIAIDNFEIYYDHTAKGEGNLTTVAYELAGNGMEFECNANDAGFRLPTPSDFRAAVGDLVELK